MLFVSFKLYVTTPPSSLLTLKFVPSDLKCNPDVNVVVFTVVSVPALYPIVCVPILFDVTTLFPPIVTSPVSFKVNVELLSPFFNSIDLRFFKSLDNLNVNVSVESPFSTLILSLAVSPATVPSPTKFNLEPSAVVTSPVSLPLNLIPPFVKVVILFEISSTLLVKLVTFVFVIFNCLPVTASVEVPLSSASVSPVIFLEFTVILSSNVNFALFSPDEIEVIPVKSDFKLNLTTPLSPTSAVVFVPSLKSNPSLNFISFLDVFVFAVYFIFVSTTSVFVT